MLLLKKKEKNTIQMNENIVNAHKIASTKGKTNVTEGK